MWLIFLKLVKKIPWQLYAVAGLGLALWSFGAWQRHQGASEVQGKWDASIARGKVIVDALKDRQDVVTHTVETIYKDKIITIKEKGDVIVKQVKVFVPDGTCDLPGGFRLLHDAAAANAIPDPTSIPNAQPVPAQTVASTVAENYSTCHQAITELEGLRSWVTEQEKLNK